MLEKYGPLAKADAISKQDFDNAVQTNLANQAQVKAASAAIGARSSNSGLPSRGRSRNHQSQFHSHRSPIDGIAGIAQAQVGDLVSTTSGALTTVSTLNPIRDYFTVSEQEYLGLANSFWVPVRNNGNCSSSWPTGRPIRTRVSSILLIAR